MAKNEIEMVRIQAFVPADVVKRMADNVKKLTKGTTNRPKTNGDMVKIVIDKFNEFMMEDTK